MEVRPKYEWSYKYGFNKYMEKKTSRSVRKSWRSVMNKYREEKDSIKPLELGSMTEYGESI